MNVADITTEDVEYFFNKYKYNSEQVFHLERKMIAESYDFSKWEEMRAKTSVVTRKYFVENEKLMDVCLRPAIATPDLLKEEVVEKYLRLILLFLFESNIDQHLCEDFPKSVLKSQKKYSDLIIFEANLVLGISLSCGGSENFDEANEYFNKAWSIYKNFNAAPDNDTRVNMAIGYSYHMMAYALYKSDDYAGFIKVYNNFERIIRFNTDDLCVKMWGPEADYQLHTEIILRHMRCFGIMIAGLNNYDFKDDSHKTEENYVALKNICTWVEREFSEEEVEGCFNPMVFTYYYKLRYKNNQIDFYNYQICLLDLFNKIKSNELTYSEAEFPQDDDPLDPQFARVIDKMKIFSFTFTSTYILYPELYSLTDDEELEMLLIGLIRKYFINCKYAAKGFSEDRYIIDLVLTISKSFKSVEEFISFINTIFVHRQISSAIHFSMVQSLTTMCFSHMVVRRPDLFVIPGKYDTSEQVLAHKKELMDFIRNGSALHDIGKLGSTNAVNLHYRRITSSEFATIKKHPELGAEIASKIPYLQEYHDLILGHHKYWDGVDGYPKEFENTYSIYRNYIGLLTICDCIDTSTDSQGRNYAKVKNFDDVLFELKADVGRRYSQELVEIIDGDESLKDELRYATSSVRKFTSYKTYNEYIQPNTNFSKENEKDVCIYRKEMHDKVAEFYKKCYQDKDVSMMDYIFKLIENKDNKTLVVHDMKGDIYGIFTGRVLKEDDELIFNIDELLVLPQARRKGLASELIIDAIITLKPYNVKRLRINYKSIDPTANFFWIQGFVPAPNGAMEKQI